MMIRPVVPKPNQMSTSGTSATVGMTNNALKYGLSVQCATVDRPMRMPKNMPSTDAIARPATSSMMLWPSASGSSPLPIMSISAEPIASTDGSTSGSRRPERSCHATSSTARKVRCGAAFRQED